MLGTAAPSLASHLFSDTAEHTTLEQILVGDRVDAESDYSELTVRCADPGDTPPCSTIDHVVRAPRSVAQSDRDQRRRSLSYFGQMTDFQLADEESPARVEFLDPTAGPDPQDSAASAWRPQEALAPFVIDWSIRQMNLFADESPVLQGNGSRAAMDLALMTGDQADNAQRNETAWVRQLLEGESLNPNSGIAKNAAYNLEHPSCAPYSDAASAAEAPKYTGVQDYDDYAPATPDDYFYDPDDVRGFWADHNWPTYPGLLDRAQLPFQPAGLFNDINRDGDQDAGESDVPSYITNGNHDGLVQGNEDAIDSFERIAMGCLKALAAGEPPASAMLVPPDPLRRFVSKPQIKAVYGANNQDDDHGFEFVSPAENTASNGSASYYSFDPDAGLRCDDPAVPSGGTCFVSIDTLSEGGAVGEASSGNIDDPQWQWLEDQLVAASAKQKLIVVFGHHPIRSLTSDSPDEDAPQCTGPQHSHGDTPEHDQNPGCDLDPRPSEPLHLGAVSNQDPHSQSAETLRSLFNRSPHVVAYVAGHTHENDVRPCGSTTAGCGGAGTWWEINTAATADWPPQHRLIELMDNRDGTLSIFGTVLDAAAQASTPASGSSAAAFDEHQLASIGRTITYNDPQVDHASEGAAEDQNVELLVPDPRPLCEGTGASIVGTAGDDTLTGTPGDDVIFGQGGNDTISGLGGHDIICGGTGDDELDGGEGADILSGGTGSNDTASYAGRASSVTVDIDGTADDGNASDGGPAGARDNVKTDVENLVGGARGDTLTGSAANNRLAGGNGADVLSGLGGIDAAAYAGRTIAVIVDIDDVADDGSASDGSGDNVRTDVENLIGGNGGDTLTGSAANNSFIGNAGADIFSGLEGRDTANYNWSTGPVTLDIDDVADDGNSADGPAGARDNIRTDVENLIGGSGNDTLTGSASANRIDAGAGADILRGLGANDNLLANDGAADTEINCDGGPADRARVDGSDPAPIDCETIGP